MADLLLWRRLTETDFNAINGQAAPAGTGGGAMHIALGTASGFKIPLSEFLQTKSNPATIATQPHKALPGANLVFHGNPGRRGGEWRITDQFHHRHPAWRVANGFPAAYDADDRPIVFVIREGGAFHARFSTETELETDNPSLYALVNSNKVKNTGIVELSPGWASALSLNETNDALGEYEELVATAEAEDANPFDPKNIKDGRTKIVAEVVRRQGQQKFRKKLIAAYGKCAITRSSVEVTLEAAHITPYRGAQTNQVSNGLLLRGDVHTLFDLGLIAIDSATMRIRVSPLLNGTEYMDYDGKKIHLPAKAADHPSGAALDEHMSTFQSQKT